MPSDPGAGQLQRIRARLCFPSGAFATGFYFPNLGRDVVAAVEMVASLAEAGLPPPLVASGAGRA